MGACFSSTPAEKPYSSSSAANVISVVGELRQYDVPIKVYQVLHYESLSSSSSVFLCNSDRLYFDDFIPSLDEEEELQSGQIYFVFPCNKLQYKLSASDMAALAVKATVALQKHQKLEGSSASLRGRRRKNSKCRISPVILEDAAQSQKSNTRKQDALNALPVKTSELGVRGRSSGSVRKLQKSSSSRRYKMIGVRSFRIRLNTIYEEGSALQ